MSFEKWLTKQVCRDDAIGDLAKDYVDDGKVTDFTYEYLASKNACREALRAYLDARVEYGNMGLYEK